MNPTLKRIFRAIVGILFIALFARINIDLPGGIPISGQSFAVLVTAILLGRKWGTLSVLGYVIIGILGWPVFAEGAAGIKVLYSGSGGFIIGFIVAAFFTGWLGDRGWKFTFWKSLTAMSLGTFIILLFGVGKLTYDYNLLQALQWGFYPFLWGALAKIILGAILSAALHSKQHESASKG
ncbi:MAG: biotin transporter BioY [Saprospiraceae bacterium]|nr:biotin transporter BioY [Saprospiraceae bacterium]MCB9326717.1 biotin transporter BioY [Lewinellaceae bacterium]